MSCCVVVDSSDEQLIMPWTLDFQAHHLHILKCRLIWIFFSNSLLVLWFDFCRVWFLPNASLKFTRCWKITKLFFFFKFNPVWTDMRVFVPFGQRRCVTNGIFTAWLFFVLFFLLNLFTKKKGIQTFRRGSNVDRLRRCCFFLFLVLHFFIGLVGAGVSVENNSKSRTRVRLISRFDRTHTIFDLIWSMTQ